MVGHIGATPQLAEAGQDKIERVCAEDGIARSTQRGIDVESLQLQSPAQCSHNVTHDAHKHRHNYPQVVHVLLKNGNDFLEIKLSVQQPEYAQAKEQRQQIFRDMG